MTPSLAPRSAAVSRREFVGGAAAAAGLLAAGVAGASEPRRFVRGDPPGDLSPFERLHAPLLRLPPATASGARVPIVVEMSHPMTADHHVTQVHVVNERDPVPSKGVFHFTPANGQVYVAFQARLDQGVSEVTATAECIRHGSWTSARSITIPAGAGGCAGTGSPPDPAHADAILPPRIRIPQAIKHGRIRPGEIIDVQLEIRHPSRTGLAVQDGKFVPIAEPYYLDAIEVYEADERISQFSLGPALSDNPFITFRLWARREAPVRIVVTNSRGRRFEASYPIRFA
jgi:sulfur-oxidizing protein SoxY